MDSKIALFIITYCELMIKTRIVLKNSRMWFYVRQRVLFNDFSRPCSTYQGGVPLLIGTNQEGHSPLIG